MKKSFAFYGFLLLAQIGFAQPEPIPQKQFLDINNIKAAFYSAGDIGWNQVNDPQFEVPKGSGHHTLFAANLWLGGIDQLNQLHLAAQTYRQNGTDFWPGPLKTTDGTIDSSTKVLFDYVWKINKTTIDSFILWYNQPACIPSYSIPASISSWPAHGNVSQGYSQNLAPFTDVNGDGFYSPSDGDYPLIKGDQALYFIYNDNYRTHTESGAAALKVEIHGMAYAYACTDSVLNNTVFTDYKIINRNSVQLDSMYIGLWADLELGEYSDDALGCDISRNCFYTYNLDNMDGNYGTHPPSQGMVILEAPSIKPLSGFITYQNDFNTAQGNPATPLDYYSYLKSIWKDGSPITYGGSGYLTGAPTNYMFSGTSDVSATTEWKNTSFADYRAISSSGPFTLDQGQEVNYKVAYVFGRDYSSTASNLSSVDIMLDRVDSLRNRFSNGQLNTCTSVLTSERKIAESHIQIFPNPTQSKVTISNSKQISSVQLYDVNLKQIDVPFTKSEREIVIDISAIRTGMYVFKVCSGETTEFFRVIKQ